MEDGVRVVNKRKLDDRINIGRSADLKNVESKRLGDCELLEGGGRPDNFESLKMTEGLVYLLKATGRLEVCRILKDYKPTLHWKTSGKLWKIDGAWKTGKQWNSEIRR